MTWVQFPAPTQVAQLQRTDRVTNTKSKNKIFKKTVSIYLQFQDLGGRKILSSRPVWDYRGLQHETLPIIITIIMMTMMLKWKREKREGTYWGCSSVSGKLVQHKQSPRFAHRQNKLNTVMHAYNPSTLEEGQIIYRIFLGCIKSWRLAWDKWSPISKTTQMLQNQLNPKSKKFIQHLCPAWPQQDQAYTW